MRKPHVRLIAFCHQISCTIDFWFWVLELATSVTLSTHHGAAGAQEAA